MPKSPVNAVPRKFTIAFSAVALVVVAGVVAKNRQSSAAEREWWKLPTRAPSSGDAKPELPPKEAAKACLATANELARHGYRREAIALYERARHLDVKQSQVCRMLAVLYDVEGLDQKALAEFALAVELFPQDPDLWNDAGCFHLSRREHDAAEECFRNAVKFAPNHERAWTNLGIALGEAGRFQESFNAFSRATNPAAAHSNVGMLLARSGRHEAASRAFRNALSIDPDLPQARAAAAYLNTTAIARQQ